MVMRQLFRAEFVDEDSCFRAFSPWWHLMPGPQEDDALRDHWAILSENAELRDEYRFAFSFDQWEEYCEVIALEEDESKDVAEVVAAHALNSWGGRLVTLAVPLSRETVIDGDRQCIFLNNSRC